MVAADPPSAQVTAAASESVQAFAELIGAIRLIERVHRVALSREGPQVALWVVLGEEDLDEMERIHLLERDFRRRASALPFRLHVVALSRVPEEYLPEATTVFER